jgi:ATP-dependent exoDNAse (exonuclease V), alpha subunit - helicase superfamily I member
MSVWQGKHRQREGDTYRLADDIWGIGFKTADGIARKMGYEMNDERRLRSGLIYTLNQLADEGHCYAGSSS